VYEFAEANNITVVGGSSKSVGAAGGWLTGGGHSLLSNTHGLGVDNALQIRAVLPNGTKWVPSGFSTKLIRDRHVCDCK
jgi:FAD/FMN-containing dehydrogenase